MLGAVARDAEIEDPPAGPGVRRPLVSERIAKEHDIERGSRDCRNGGGVSHPGLDSRGRGGNAGSCCPGRDCEALARRRAASGVEWPAEPSAKPDSPARQWRSRSGASASRGRPSSARKASIGAAPGWSRDSQSATARAAGRRPTRGEELAKPRKDGQVIGFDRHRLVELCDGFVVPPAAESACAYHAI